MANSPVNLIIFLYIYNVAGKVLTEIQSSWNEKSRTCFIGFENNPDGINVEFQW